MCVFFYVCLNLFIGKVPGDDILLVDLNIKPNAKIMMMGSKAEEVVYLVTCLFVTRNLYIDKLKVKWCDHQIKYIKLVVVRVSCYLNLHASPPGNRKNY